MKIGELFTFFTDTILVKDTTEWRNPLLRWLVRQYRLLFYTARGLVEHGTMIRSAALTFYTMMSIVPIVALVFAIVKGFGMVDDLIQNLYTIFAQNPEIVHYIVDFAEKAVSRTQGGIVAAVGFVALFWAVIRVFSSIESAFNNIWEVKVQRSVARQWADYIVVVIVVPILGVAASAFGNYTQELLGFDGSWYYELISRLASLMIVWFMFAMLYIIIPNTKVHLSSALMAGIIAGSLFMLFQWGYIYVQRWMSSYNAIYGSFAALPLFLIWMQSSWQILLFGGELSFAYQNISRFGEERESLLISNELRRNVALSIMLTIIREFRDKGGALSNEHIRERLDLPVRIVNDVLYQLIEAKLLIAVRAADSDKQISYVPSQDISKMTIYNILMAVDCRDNSQSLHDFISTPESKRVERELELIREGIKLSHGDVKLMDMLLEKEQCAK